MSEAMKRSYTCECGVMIFAENDAMIDQEVYHHQRRFNAKFGIHETYIKKCKENEVAL